MASAAPVPGETEAVAEAGDAIPADEPVLTLEQALAEEKTLLLWRPARNERPHAANPRHRRELAGNGPAGDGPAGDGEIAKTGDRGNARVRDKVGFGRKDRPRGDAKPGGKPGQGRDDRYARRDHKQESQPPRETKRAPEKPVDPDSPFAKLLLLKAQMEKGKN